jgi:2-polyprenyl-6-methoxyphenol hydroxylase-like FAD-dependent oxidoreductase
MKRIGIVGGGISGLHLGLWLREYGADATIYAEKTAGQLLDAPLRNIVIRNGCTRQRERDLRVNHWDDSAPDLGGLSVTVAGTPIAFVGRLAPPSNVVDMRIYCARLLEDFSARGGRVVIGTLAAGDLDELSARHDLLVMASGRGSLSNVFERVPEHSPNSEPQRLVIAGFFRGIRPLDPLGFEVVISRGHGEILVFPLFSFESGLTGLGIEAIRGGAFNRLSEVKYANDPRRFEQSVLDILRDHAPTVYQRVTIDEFSVARPQDVGYIAITPTVRRGYRRLDNGRHVVALGDAHVVMDPITGQGANKAAEAAATLAEAIRDARDYDESFCRDVEQLMCRYALPVSDACNARLKPPAPHVARLLAGAAQHQALADFYAFGFDHPDRYWEVISSEDRTDALLQQVTAGVKISSRSN